MLVANTASYIDYMTAEAFVNLQLAEPFRTFTDEELINYSVRDGKMNFPLGTSQQYSGVNDHHADSQCPKVKISMRHVGRT